MTNRAETWPDFYTLVVVYTERLEGEGDEVTLNPLVEAARDLVALAHPVGAVAREAGEVYARFLGEQLVKWLESEEQTVEALRERGIHARGLLDGARLRFAAAQGEADDARGGGLHG